MELTSQDCRNECCECRGATTAHPTCACPTCRTEPTNRITFAYLADCDGFMVKRVDGTAQTFTRSPDTFVLLAETFGWEGRTDCETDTETETHAYCWLRNLYDHTDDKDSLTAEDPCFFDHC